MLDQVRLHEALQAGRPDSPNLADRQPTIDAMRALAAETNDLVAYLHALNTAAWLEREPLGP